jgi:O-antigen ligase
VVIESRLGDLAPAWLREWLALAGLLAAALAGVFIWLTTLLQASLAIAALAIIILTIVQPMWGLGAALIAGPFGALENILLLQSVTFSGPAGLDTGQILFLLALISWSARGLARRWFVLPKSTLNTAFFVLFIAMLISLSGALSPALGLRELLKWAEIMLAMWIVCDISCWEARATSTPAPEVARKTWRRIVVVAGALLAAGALQAVIGIWQFALRGEGPEHFLVLGRYYRAYGTFEQPNPFGGFMNLSVFLAFGILAGLVAPWWSGKRQRRLEEAGRTPTPVGAGTQKWPGRRYLVAVIAVAFVAVVTSLALLFSWSRGAWLGFVAGATVFLFFLPRRRKIGVLLFGFITAIFLGSWTLGLLPPAVSARLADFAEDLQFGDVRGADINDANYAVLERLAHWQAAIAMAQEQPWKGVGAGNYEAVYARYALINWPAPLGHAHNYYLNALAETGVIGLLAYLGFWGTVIWQTWRLLLRSWPERGLALGLLAAWAAVSAHHLVDKLTVNNVYIHLGAMLGLVQLLAASRPGSAPRWTGPVKDGGENT